MRKTGKTSAILLAVLLICFGLGLYALFDLRFRQGDVFPAYSSLRSDPLGSKALYQALDLLPGVSVQRHYLGLSKLAPPKPATVFCLGLKPSFLTETPPELVDKMDTLVERGARLVLAFQSGQRRPARTAGKDRLRKGPGGQADESEGGYQDAGIEKERIKALKAEPKPGALVKWGLSLDYAKLPKGKQRRTRKADLRVSAADLPPTISSHTGLYFKNPGSAWRIVYGGARQPVIIERPMGAGSLVLVADSYLFSNEALRNERYPALLAWLVGANSMVVFDESHLGVREQPGVMDLVRKYRLHGVLAVLALMAGLFVWRDAVPFIPNRGVRSAANQRGASSGRDQLQGLIHLLRRNIEPGEVLRKCVDEWRRSIARDSRGKQEQLRRIEELMERRLGKSIRAQDAVALYRKIAAILAERS